MLHNKLSIAVLIITALVLIGFQLSFSNKSHDTNNQLTSNDVTDWEQTTSKYEDFNVRLPKNPKEDLEEGDTPLLAYTGKDSEAVYIVQRVDYSSMVKDTHGSRPLEDETIKEILQMRMNSFISKQGGKITGSHLVTFLNKSAIEFSAESSETELEGLIFWDNNKTYTLISIINLYSVSQFEYLKSNFSLVR